MTLEQRIETIEKKLDAVLAILGHGREKSDAELEREVAADMERFKAKKEKRREKLFAQSV